MRSSNAFAESAVCANICGLPILTESVEVIAARLIETIRRGQGMRILTLNLEMIAQLYLDAQYARLLSNVDYATADGMPIVWAARWAKQPEIAGRSTGVALSRMILYSPEIERIALIGGIRPHAIAQGVKPCAARKYLVWDGDIVFSETRAQALVNELKEKHIQIVLLALGIDKQDQFAYYIRKHFPEVTVMGVGGSLDVLAGLRRTAPLWMQNTGLEWLFRLLNEPNRLWRRYLLRYPFGVLFLIQQLLK